MFSLLWEAKVITNDQMDEWVKEVEERPSSGAVIVRFISNRLRDLTRRNEELLAENIELRSGNKVEEYESRIANLEYQLELLKRQIGGDLSALPGVLPADTAMRIDTVTLLLYTPTGKVLRMEWPVEEMVLGKRMAGLTEKAEPYVRMLVTNQQEELLFVYDSGRSETLAVADIPVLPVEKQSWKNAFLMEPRAGEQLATVLAVGKMALADYVVQASRRGCARKLMRTSFESHLAKNYIGTGVLVKTDQTCTLALCSKEDRFVIASREGFLVNLDISRLPFTTEEAFRIGPTDYIISGFVPSGKPSILVMTHNGKAIHREAAWLELAATNKTRGQPVFSQSRRDAGTRVIGAAAVDENDWGIALHRDGGLTFHKLSNLLADGAVAGEDVELVEFVVFTPPTIAAAK